MTDEEDLNYSKKEDSDYEEEVDYGNIDVEDSEDSESESSSSFSEELKTLKGEELKTLKEEIYNKAIETKTPDNLIINYQGKIESIIELQKNNKSILENYRFFINNNIRINSDMFILAYYFANKKKTQDYLIENFNNFREISNSPEYYKKSFNTYRDSFEEKYKFMYDITLEKSKKYYSLIEKIKDLGTVDNFSDIMKTFSISNSEIDYVISDDDYEVDIENGKIIFDNIETNNFFPFIRYIGEEEYYKIYSKDIKYDYFIQLNKNLPKEKNKIVFFINPVVKRGIFSGQLITIDLNTSAIKIQYPENYLNFLKDKIFGILPNLEFLKQKEKNISGSFEIFFPEYNEFKIYYMTLFDNIFREFLFIRESNSCRSLKENIKFYYTGTDIEKKNLNYSLFFNITNINIDRFIVNFKSKFTNSKFIYEFITIFQKLIYHYKEEKKFNYLSIIETPYTGINGYGMGSKDKYMDTDIISKKKKKIDVLLNNEPNLFSKNLYVRTCPCPKQPIIIDKKDKKYWENYELNGEKGEVVLFPPEESTQNSKKNYYVCPDDIYRKVSYKENPDKNSLFPVIPCCSITKTNQFLYDNYDKIVKGKFKIFSEYKGKNIGTLKTSKILLDERFGEIPTELSKILSSISDKDIVREGVKKNNKSSFLHCIFKGLEGKELIKEDFPRKEFFTVIYKLIKKYKEDNRKNAYVDFFRKNILQGKEVLKIEFLSQELYSYTKEEIKELLEDPTTFFDSKLFYKIPEFLYSINVFVFSFDKITNETKFETPNHQFYNNREIREDLPCLILLRHKRFSEFDVYELIRNKEKKFEETDSYYIFPPKFTSLIQNIIRTGDIYNINISERDFIVRKNSNFNINWSYILRDYTPVSQILNSSGRTFSISFQYSKNKEDIMTMFIRESFPMEVESSEKFHITSKKKCIKIFGKKYIEGNCGLFYSINDDKYGCFIPCKDVSCNKDNKELTSSNYNIMLDITTKNRKISNIEITKSNSLKLKDVIIWLYLIEKEDFESWWEKYFIEDKKIKKELFNSIPFKFEYRFPKKISTTAEGIKYLNLFSPEIFDKKIYFYKELYNNIKNFLKNYTRSRNIEVEQNRKTLKSCLEYSKDFKKYKFNTLIINNDKYRFWENNINYETKDYRKIENRDIDLIYPFVWNNEKNNKIYFIQNNKEHSMEISIFLCYMWKLYQRNENFEEKSSPWKILSIIDKKDRDRDKYDDILGWSFENTKEYCEQITNKKYLFTERYEYFKLLDDLKVDFKPGKDFSHVIYSKINDDIDIIKKFIVDDNPPFEIYLYQDGGFASMLNII